MLGILALVLLWRVDYHLWEKLDDILLIGTFFLIVLTFIPGLSAGGQWIALGPLSFQPTELGKLSLILYVSGSLIRRGERARHFRQGVLPYLGVLGAFGLLLILQSDIGMLICYGAIVAFLLWAGGVPLRHLLLTAAGLFPVLGVLFLAAPYRVGRLLAFLNPAVYEDTLSYQVSQSLLAIGSGGIWGRGIGASRAKFFYLPSAHNDFVFAVLAEETGLWGTLLVIFVLGALVALGFKAALRADDRLGTLYALGASFTLGFQSFLNLGVTVGILPVTGLTLPFLSYGGSSLMVSLALVGLVLGVARMGER
jgi:cell division protein FtsW